LCRRANGESGIKSTLLEIVTYEVSGQFDSIRCGMSTWSARDFGSEAPAPGLSSGTANGDGKPILAKDGEILRDLAETSGRMTLVELAALFHDWQLLTARYE
jgi:hypothetical protein